MKLINFKDIDAKFGTIWKATRNKSLLSPQAYERMLRQTFKSDTSHHFDVIDVFVIPDYKEFFEGHYFAPENWSRGKYTNHQFKFDRPPAEERHHFPLNVRMQYRMYCADEYIEIDEVTALPIGRRSEDGLLLGYQAYKKGVFWAPAAKYDRPARGMYVLTSLPTDLFVMQNFCFGSRERLVAVATSISNHFKPNGLREFEPSEDWAAFLRHAPQSNRVNDFTELKSPHIPLASFLLGLETIATVTQMPAVKQGGAVQSAPLIAFSGENIKWDKCRHPESPTLWIPNNSVPIAPLLDISIILDLNVPEIVKRIERVNIDYGMQIKTKQKKDALAQQLLVAYSMIARSESAASAVAGPIPGTAAVVHLKIEGEPTLKEIKVLMKQYNTMQTDESQQFKQIDKMHSAHAKEKWAARAPLDSGDDREVKKPKLGESASVTASDTPRVDGLSLDEIKVLMTDYNRSQRDKSKQFKYLNRLKNVDAAKTLWAARSHLPLTGVHGGAGVVMAATAMKESDGEEEHVKMEEQGATAAEEQLLLLGKMGGQGEGEYNDDEDDDDGGSSQAGGASQYLTR